MEKGFYFCNTYDFKKVDFEPSKTQNTVSKNMITVLYIQANHYPKAVAIDNSLEAMQKLVGGNIEEYMPFEDEVAIICNEEGKMNGLPLNRAVYDEKTKEIIDIIAGDFFIAYAPIDSEKFKDLPKDLEQKYREKFKFPERFYKQNAISLNTLRSVKLLQKTDRPNIHSLRKNTRQNITDRKRGNIFDKRFQFKEKRQL